MGPNGDAEGGGLFSLNGTVTVGNTIIDLNQSGTNLNNTPPGSGARFRPAPMSGPGPGATIASQGNNLIGSTLGAGANFTASGDQTGVTQRS